MILINFINEKEEEENIFIFFREEEEEENISQLTRDINLQKKKLKFTWIATISLLKKSNIYLSRDLGYDLFFFLFWDKGNKELGYDLLDSLVHGFLDL